VPFAGVVPLATSVFGVELVEAVTSCCRDPGEDSRIVCRRRPLILDTRSSPLPATDEERSEFRGSGTLEGVSLESWGR